MVLEKNDKIPPSKHWDFNFLRARCLCRKINDFKKGYQPRSNLVKDENGDLLADSHNILIRWKNYFSQLLNVHRVSDVRQIEYIQLSH
jgi:hypothetical protein